MAERFTLGQGRSFDVAKFSEILIRDQIINEEDRVMITRANAHYFEDPDILTWFAYQADRPVGMLWLILNSDRKDMSDGSNFAELHQFRVISDFRGQKVGSLLYRVVEDEAKRRSFRSLTLAVEKDNLAAQNIYQHWGFQPKGTRVEDFGLGLTIESIRMVKSLDQSLTRKIYGEWEV